jgi:hypothetical protein
MIPDLERVRENVAGADTEDLLDRATVYRNGMEPEALDLIDAELRARGVGEAELAAHWGRRVGTLVAADGLALRCGLPQCPRPAVARRWGWNRGWGLMPLFPRPQPFCEVHLPQRWWFRLSD